jgi:hypothetical protein
MTITAYYTSAAASPINQKRAGTIRVGSDSPSPIVLNNGFTNTLMFAFRDHNNKVELLDGRTYTVNLYNIDNVLLASSSLSATADTPGLGNVTFTRAQLAPLESGRYNLIIIDTTDVTETIVTSSHGSIRFEVQVNNYVM